MDFLQISQGQYSQLIDSKSVKDIHEDIFHFISSLKARRSARSSQKVHLSALLHFYLMNDIALDRKKLSRYLSNDDINPDAYDDDQEEDRPYTIQEIAKLLEHSTDLRTKVEILLMASAGTRLGSLELLKIRDLTPVDKYNLYQIRVYANSKSNTRFTFCTPECRKAIDSYLDYRRRSGERLLPNSPLLRRDFNSPDWDEPQTIKIR
jgi:site-specific recombinase XerD